MGWAGERKKVNCDAGPAAASASPIAAQIGPPWPGLSLLHWSVIGCRLFLEGKATLPWTQSPKGNLSVGIPVAGTSPPLQGCVGGTSQGPLQSCVGGTSQGPLQSRTGHWEPESNPFLLHKLREKRTFPALSCHPTCVGDSGVKGLTVFCFPFIIL